MPSVLFHVQHLLGIGHVKRAATLARAMSARGIEVTLVSGGEHVPVLDDSGMRFVQLPPVKASDRTFGFIVDADGREIGNEFRTERRDMLIGLLNEIRPDVLILELYPFGRRQLRSELTPLIEAAREMSPRPRIVSSVRDILVEKNRPDRDREMVDTAKRLFDAVLVHGDPALIPFDRTFPPAGEIADLLRYTGYVVEHRKIETAKGEQGTGEVIVSSGSGAVGELLLRTAIGARPHTSYSDIPWRLLAGYSLPEDVFEDIAGTAPDGVVVERAREDFVTLLKNCRLSISQGGYNTIMEVLACGARGIAVPYAGGHETEQTLRARLLEERGLIQQMPEGELTVEKLVAAIERAESLDPPDPDSIDTGGAEETARLVEHLILTAGAGSHKDDINV